jgi:hypothetical protein
MKRSSALFLQTVIVLVGIVTLALMLWEPHLEGRNVNATPFEIYFKDPFLAYVYVGSTPFFVALYRAFELLSDAGQKGRFSHTTVEALRAIKRCAIALIGFVLGAAVLLVVLGDGEDRAGGIFMSFLATVGASVMAVTATMLARNLQNTLRRSEVVRS